MANFWVDKIVYDTPLNKQMNERGLPQVVKSSIALVRDYLKETIEVRAILKQTTENLGIDSVSPPLRMLLIYSTSLCQNYSRRYMTIYHPAYQVNYIF